ncbi:MAG: prepilin peptidase [Spirochaetaceae bacterium]|nr:prepilin peptidase [Spirochaetaceae bacterium]
MKIHDVLIFPAIVIFSILKLIFLEGTILNVLIIPLISSAFFLFIWFFSKGGLGMGDVKFTFLIVLHLGFEKWLFSIFISSLMGIIFGLLMLITKKLCRKSKLDFAPFLSIGALAALILK